MYVNVYVATSYTKVCILFYTVKDVQICYSVLILNRFHVILLLHIQLAQEKQLLEEDKTTLVLLKVRKLQLQCEGKLEKWQVKILQ